MARLIGLATVVASVLVVVNAAAQDATYQSPSAAAEAALAELLPEWHVAGDCSAAMDPGPSDVCYRFTPGRSTNAFSIYSAYALESAGSAWWAGVAETDDGWKGYDAGRCDLVYCRMTAPGDILLVGFPSGDGNCDGTADSEDALLVLQVVADLVGEDFLPCIADADVDATDSLTSLDALAILQSDAGLIGPLPVRLR